jgi:FtsH-binding integral membrane protein
MSDKTKNNIANVMMATIIAVILMTLTIAVGIEDYSSYEIVPFMITFVIIICVIMFMLFKMVLPGKEKES